ncbi:MAG: SDR family NAD(P)-dependent oxidoreductase [Polyangiaceae bacterium]|nr:SDR family NAD(P)-dependent oxidoreductase [Polyangiaceae bacterium]
MPNNVVITGAASGIGRATAKAYAAAGDTLYLCDVDEAGLASLKKELGDRVGLTATVDVSNAPEMKAFAEQVLERKGSVDILVNNAGVGLAGGLVETSLEDWNWILGINLMGVVHGCHYFAPSMMARKRGHIVNVASVLGFVGLGSTTAYATSKFAVLGFSESLRADLRPHDVHVTTICPGLIATNIAKEARTPPAWSAAQEQALEVFRKRGTPPEVVANAIVASTKRKGGLVPVSKDAWALYFARRFFPAALESFSALVERKLKPAPQPPR